MMTMKLKKYQRALLALLSVVLLSLGWLRTTGLVLLVALCGCSVSEHRRVGGQVSIAYLRSLLDDSSTPVLYDLTISGYVVANDRYGDGTI